MLIFFFRGQEGWTRQRKKGRNEPHCRAPDELDLHRCVCCISQVAAESQDYCDSAGMLERGQRMERDIKVGEGVHEYSIVACQKLSDRRLSRNASKAEHPVLPPGLSAPSLTQQEKGSIVSLFPLALFLCGSAHANAQRTLLFGVCTPKLRSPNLPRVAKISPTQLRCNTTSTGPVVLPHRTHGT